MKKYIVKPNEAVNIAYLKENGFDAVYLCASKGEQKDPAFEGNYKAAFLANMRIGIYHEYMAPKCDDGFVTESAKEGRTFAAALVGKVYALPLCLNFRSDVDFDGENFFKHECTNIRNGVNAFAQYVDKELVELGDTSHDKVWNTENLVLRASAEHMKFIKADEDNRVYTLEVVD